MDWRGRKNWNDANNWENVTLGGVGGFPISSDTARFPIEATAGGGAAQTVEISEAIDVDLAAGSTTTVSGAIENGGVLGFELTGAGSGTRLRLGSAEVTLSGGELALNQDAAIDFGFNGAATLVNGGGVISMTQEPGDGSPRGSIGLNRIVNIQNEGLIDVRSGELRVNGDVTGSGDTVVESGNLTVAGDTFEQKSLMLSSGEFNFSGANFSVSSVIGAISLGGAAVSTGGDIGTATYLGDLELTEADLNIRFASADLFDVFEVEGSLSLANTDLRLNFDPDFLVAAGDNFEIVTAGAARTGQFENFSEGQAVGTFGDDLFITYRAGDGDDVALFSTSNPNDVVFADASDGDDVVFIGTRSETSPVDTVFTFESLDLLAGADFTLGPKETLDLGGDGVLVVNDGAVFTGNGIVDGDILNAGLVRIPIVPLTDPEVINTITRVEGGLVEVPQSPDQERTIIVSPTQPGGGGGAGAGPGFSAGVTAGGGTIVSIEGSTTIQDTVLVRDEVVRFDADLEVTGDFTQTDTGALRLFIGGDQLPGESYSQLLVGGAVALDGALQIVFDPLLFSEFGYSPMVGDFFDFVVADDGVTLDDDLLVEAFTVNSGRDLINEAFELTEFVSENPADPDSLFRFTRQLFGIELVNDNTTLRATLREEFLAPNVVPLPSSVVLLASAIALLGSSSMRRRTPPLGYRHSVRRSARARTFSSSSG